MPRRTKHQFISKNPYSELDSTVGVAEDQVKLVVFTIDRELYALSIDQVVEIDKLMEITPVPNMGESIVGLIDLRGEILPVVDPEKKFNLKRENLTLKRCIIVCKTANGSFGIIVDDVSKIISFPKDMIDEPPNLIKSKINANYLKGVGVLNNKVFIILNAEKVLLPEELKVTK